MIKNVGDYFCSKPFEWFEIAGNYKYFLCCPGWLCHSIGNNTQSPQLVWNSIAAQEIRESILDGSFKFCSKECPYLEEKSHCVQTIDSVTDARLQKIIKNKLVVLKDGPKWLNLSNDKSCNLCCPSCRQCSFQATGNELEKAKDAHSSLLCTFKDQLEWVYITGSGDPFGAKSYRDLLRSMHQDDYPNIKLYLHTNGILFNKKSWNSIPNIRRAIRWVHVSIDAATSETYAINRPGADWNTLMTNLQFISALRKDGPIERFEISMVVQNNNWKEMVDFVELGRLLNVDSVLFTTLRNWALFTEDEYRHRAVHLKNHPNHFNLIKLLQSVHLLHPTVSLGTLKRFVKWKLL